MSDDPRPYLTAGDWQKRTKVERTIAAFFLLTLSMCGLTGGLGALFVFAPGELSGDQLADAVVLIAVLATSGLALRQGLFLLEGPVCRSCRARLSETQFRCPRCTALVDQN